MSLPIPSTAFTIDLQQQYINQIALAADISAPSSPEKNSTGTIVISNIEVISSRRRRLLSEAISFDVSIACFTALSATKIASLLTPDRINLELNSAGLVPVQITSSASLFISPSLESTPSPPSESPGITKSNIIAIATSLGGSMMLAIFGCCLKKLNEWNYLPSWLKNCIPNEDTKRQYSGDQETQINSRGASDQNQSTNVAHAPAFGRPARQNSRDSDQDVFPQYTSFVHANGRAYESSAYSGRLAADAWANQNIQANLSFPSQHYAPEYNYRNAETGRNQQRERFYH
jgi:hypothetical protein